EKVARRVLFGVPDDIDIEEQIEWIDTIIGRDPQKFGNPAGMYVSFIKDGITPPPTFLSSRRRNRLRTTEGDHPTTDQAQDNKQFDLEIRYSAYREPQANSYLQSLTPDARSKLNRDAKKAAAKHVARFDVLTIEQQEGLIYRFAFSMA